MCLGPRATHTHLISFDAKNMFTSISVNAAEELMADILLQKGTDPEMVGEFRDLLSICLKYNLCVYQFKQYEFPDGLPMGAPLSMLVADIYMDRLQQDIIGNFPSDRCIRYWAKYVDDILCVWQGTERAARNLLEGLNTYNPSISFSMEFGGSKIAYLDLLISLEPHHNALRLTFQVHRKPTFTGVSIHQDSLHPAAQKLR